MFINYDPRLFIKVNRNISCKIKYAFNNFKCNRFYFLNTRRTEICDYLEGPNAQLTQAFFFELSMLFSLYCKASKKKTVHI